LFPPDLHNHDVIVSVRSSIELDRGFVLPLCNREIFKGDVIHGLPRAPD
jgi:hypothetical protein